VGDHKGSPLRRILSGNEIQDKGQLLIAIRAVIIAGVGGIDLMGSLSSSMIERTHEIGVIRAIGARFPTIMGRFVLEGLFQGLLSWLLAILLSFFFFAHWPARCGRR
jgi:ABC-type antimicrobial peptide transport system permease subunit